MFTNLVSLLNFCEDIIEYDSPIKEIISFKKGEKRGEVDVIIRKHTTDTDSKQIETHDTWYRLYGIKFRQRFKRQK